MHFHTGFQILFLALLSFFNPEKSDLKLAAKHHKTSKIVKTHKHSRTHYYSGSIDTSTISTGCTTPDELVTFAKSLRGIRYRFGSTNPEKGFDCSGFVNYVFHHFGIGIPRSSIDFASAFGRVALSEARTGDLILFTGTKKSRRAGHIGIVISEPGEPVMFIHSTSGAANGVTETPLNDYYMGRYIKTIRLFSDNSYNPIDSTSSDAERQDLVPAVSSTSGS
ncbi:C40 family peptidase [Mucilaginibacter sabulilitoris]|uniref:C40 family peptidase n=1 Tax=Mucilaginibacter sabulilitoris TaxID=1173583 RepID=A0ABZ0TPY7_9SPHI|nr:C40 family peptidase [Mucilaginibacter sabulilitoris]WPU94253.1 C40 family peptidase [Mucilaginibacter sabulilitoris]